jgi:hypothetical protein
MVGAAVIVGAAVVVADRVRRALTAGEIRGTMRA